LTTHCCILWSVRNNHWKVDQKIIYHQKKIKDASYTLWGVNFLMNKDKFRCPIKGFMHVKGTGNVYYETRVIDIIRENDISEVTFNNHIPELFQNFRFKTYLALDKLEKLSKPIPTEIFKKCDNDEFIGNAPQSYISVKLPDLI